MSMFCSNSLIFAPESCKCILRGPDFNIFSQDMPQTPLPAHTLALANGAYGASFLLFCPLQNFCHPLKTLLKTLFWSLTSQGKFLRHPCAELLVIPLYIWNNKINYNEYKVKQWVFPPWFTFKQIHWPSSTFRIYTVHCWLFIWSGFTLPVSSCSFWSLACCFCSDSSLALHEMSCFSIWLNCCSMWKQNFHMFS